MMAGTPVVGTRRNASRESPCWGGSLRLNNQPAPVRPMSDDNSPSFYWSLERFWEGLSVLTLALGILVWLIEPYGGLTADDGLILLTISVVSVLQAIYFDRKTQAALKRTSSKPN